MPRTAGSSSPRSAAASAWCAPGGSQTAGTVIDISGHVANAGDRGLLGIAVDVGFATNHYLYLLYTYDADPVDRGG